MEEDRQIRLLTQEELDALYLRFMESGGSAELRDELLDALDNLAAPDRAEFWHRTNETYGTLPAIDADEARDFIERPSFTYFSPAKRWRKINPSNDELEAMQGDLMDRVREVKEEQEGDV